MPDCDPLALSHAATGLVLSSILHLRQVPVLHAAVACVGPAAFGFLGHSDAGKSTLAAAFLERGHPVLSDDLLPLYPVPGGYATHAGARHMKLARRVVEIFGLERSVIPGQAETAGEVLVQLPDAVAGPQRVGGLFLLEEGSSIEIAPVAPQESLARLIGHTHAWDLVGPQAPWHFSACAAVAAGIPVWTLTRPKDFARLGEGLDAILSFIG